MSYAFATLEVTREVAGRIVRDRIAARNVAVRAGIRDYTIGNWAQRSYAGVPNLYVWPWRLPPQWDGGLAGPLLRAAAFTSGGYPVADGYPYGGYLGAFGSNDATAQQFSLRDVRRFRYRLSAAVSLTSTASNLPKCIGALVVVGDRGVPTSGEVRAGALAVTDVPYASVGAPYLHPVWGQGVTTVAGQAYVTGVSLPHGRSGILRVTSGADSGVYLVHHVDRQNGRVYLSNLDGTPFVAQASASVGGALAPRRAWMNEVNVVPNGVGVATFDGAYDPGENRASYLFRLHFEKSGSPSPADASQKGSYWLSLRPWVAGHGTSGNMANTNNPGWNDVGQFRAGAAFMHSTQAGATGFFDGFSAGFGGSCLGLVLDRVNQRVWGLASNGSLFWWRYKSPECFHEAATASGTPNDPLTGVAIGTSIPRGIDIGSDDAVYVALIGGNTAGWLMIAPDLTAVQVKAADLGLSAGLAAYAVALDKSRRRTGGAATVTTSNGSGDLTATDGAFTQSDVGRALALTGVGADSGTYKVSAVADATHATVTTLAGAAVSFAGVAGGQFQIGDRIYLFFYDATTNAGKMSYFESLAFGILMTRAVAMTNGGRLAATAPSGSTASMPGPVSVDQATGCVYWASDDTTVQVNRYDPIANAWSRRLVADFNGLNGGAGTVTDPTVIYCLGVNPHASFRELWVGTNAGWLKLNPDDFAGAFSRYYGNGSDATPYSKPAGVARPDGSWYWPAQAGYYANSRTMLSVHFGPDGRVYGRALPTSGTMVLEWLAYSREADAWASRESDSSICNMTTEQNYYSGVLMTPYGEVLHLLPYKCSSSPAVHGLWMSFLDVQYQWIGNAWVAKEVVHGPLPGALSPGLSAKDLHLTLDDLVMGVKVKFTPQGGATPANNEFLGRLGQAGPAKNDGATTLGNANFAGSGFVAGNVYDYVWIESGADSGVYQITAFVNANAVTLRKLAGGAASPTASAGGLSYSVWTAGPASLPGPENVTCLCGHGAARDSMQDITNISAEFFGGKTLVSDQAEGLKVALFPPGPLKSPGPLVYFEAWAYNRTNGYEPNVPQMRALPATPLAKGIHLLDGACKRLCNGNAGTPNAAYDYTFNGRTAANSLAGFAVAIDLGTAVELGSIIVRLDSRELSNSLGNYAGCIANIHAAPDGAAPTGSGAQRTSGTGASIATQNAANSQSVANRTVTLATGDFLGGVLASGANGQVTAGGNRCTASAGAFLAAHVGAALRFTAGADQGSYRISAVAGDGSFADVTNLDQTARAFIASAAGLAYEVRDAVREEDALNIGAHLLTVERLLSPTTAEVRVTPGNTISNAAWAALKPTWPLVKRISYAVTAQPPEVANNGTYISSDGYEEGYDSYSAKLVADFTDLPSTRRSGRYWKISFMARFATGGLTTVSDGQPYTSIRSVELYDLAGKLITVCKHNKVDTVDSQAANFIACHVSRFDWIHASNTAAAHVSGANGLAAVSGAFGDTVTLQGGNVFLGYELRRGSAGSTPGGNLWNNGAGDPSFVSGTDGDVSRTLRILTGPNAGYYRIAAAAPTQVTLTTMGGVVVNLAADAGPTAFAVHDSISTATVLALAGKESPILTVSDDLTTVTVADHFFLAGAGVPWEVRRRFFAGAGGLNYSTSSYPGSAGDVSQDHRGTLAFHGDDVQTMPARSDGAAEAGTANFTGSLFSADDVGRLLVISAGADMGRYEIASYLSPSAITVRDLDAASAISFVGSGPNLTYKVQGERRYRVARYATVLRS